MARRAHGRSANRRKLAAILRDESGTSDVEYLLLTALIIVPLMVVPPLLIEANIIYFERVSGWMSLPYP